MVKVLVGKSGGVVGKGEVEIVAKSETRGGGRKLRPHLGAIGHNQAAGLNGFCHGGVAGGGTGPIVAEDWVADLLCVLLLLQKWQEISPTGGPDGGDTLWAFGNRQSRGLIKALL